MSACVKYSNPMFTDDNEITVSICCITYNQARYLPEALDSFLSQSTTFKYEIIIGNDASSDNTSHIIKEYTKNYSDIIRCIEHEENVGANANILSVLSMAKGQWIAFCEGDDYWIDNYKLQKQVDLLSASDGIFFCTHRAFMETGEKRVVHFDYGNETKLFDLKDILSVTGQFAPTSSYMFSCEIIHDLPTWFTTAPVGDLFLELYGTKNKGIYLAETLSVYRLESVGSWSESIKNDINKFTIRHLQIAKLLKKTKNQIPGYDHYFDRKITAVYLNMATRYLFEGKYSLFKRAVIKGIISNNRPTLKQKVYRFFYNAPQIMRFIHFLKSYLPR